MTVYVDDFRAPKRIGRLNGRWSHLTADTQEELHAFAERLGLRPNWFQVRCRNRCAPAGTACPHWHYDVTESKRLAAIEVGAVPIAWRQMGELASARRRGERYEPPGT